MKKHLEILFLFVVITTGLLSCSQNRESKVVSDNDPVDAMDQKTNMQVVSVDIKEWPVPWESSRPRDPYVAPNGLTWFCGQQGNFLANLDPETGEFNQYAVEEGTHPHNLIIDENGYVWYAGNQNAHIGRLDPSDGTIKKYEMPHEEARDPHTLVFNNEGNIWFTVQGGNFIGFLDTASGEVKLISATQPGSRPYGIKMDPQNHPWVVLFGTNKLATVDPATLVLSEIDLPHEDSRPRRLEITQDGLIYYVDYTRGYLGNYDPETMEFTEWALPGGSNSRPYGTAMDSEERIWIAEAGLSPNHLVAFDPKTEEFFSDTEIPSGGSVIRHMYFDPEENKIWFGTDTNTIGRADIGI